LRKKPYICTLEIMDFNTLIAECTAYDYKAMLEESRPKSWLKSVSAFANTLGGSLFFGIDNDGNVKGLDDIQHVTETISMKIRDYMDPLPDVEMIPLEQEGKHVFKSSLSQFMTIIYSTQYKRGGLNGGLNGDVNALDGLVNGFVNGPVNGLVSSLKGSLKEVYMVVTNNPGIKIGQVAKVRKKSESTVKKQLTSLRKMGLIEYRGSDKTGGYYLRSEMDFRCAED